MMREHLVIAGVLCGLKGAWKLSLIQLKNFRY